MEVLFEYSEYRCILSTEKSQVCRDIQYHLRKAGVANLAVFVLSFITNAIAGAERRTNFFLQKLNSEWNWYVNVDSLEDITSGDRLTVVKITHDTETVAAKKDTPTHVRMHVHKQQ